MEEFDREEVLRRGPLELLVGARWRPVLVALEDVEDVALESVLRFGGACAYCICCEGATLGCILYIELARWSIMPVEVVAVVLWVSPRGRW